jgi:hypothetical protein
LGGLTFALSHIHHFLILLTQTQQNSLPASVLDYTSLDNKMLLMKFVHRLGYYLGGFSIGLVLLMFFLNGKEASCDYSPNARTVKNISSKKILYSEETSTFINYHQLDSTTIINLIKYGSVDFSKSKTKIDSCKVYYIENSYKNHGMELTVKNCDSLATLLKIDFVKT